MTKCEYLDMGLRGINLAGCGQDAGWRLVAGTTACPEIRDFRLCSRHAELLRNVSDLPSRLRDSHGHPMMMVILRDLENPGGGDITLPDDFGYTDDGTSKPLTAAPREPLTVAAACGECGRYYGTALEAIACCGYRNLRTALLPSGTTS